MKNAITILFKIAFVIFNVVGAQAADAGILSSSFYGEKVSTLGISSDIKLTGSAELIGQKFVQPILERNFQMLSGSNLIQKISLQVLSDELVEITSTRNIRYVLLQSGVEVYGSAISVEIDSTQNQFLSLTIAVGNPGPISSIPKVTPRRALSNSLAKAEFEAGHAIVLEPSETLQNLVPKFYYNNRSSKWHLAYLFPAQVAVGAQPNGAPILAPVQILADAQSGEFLKLEVLFDQH